MNPETGARLLQLITRDHDPFRILSEKKKNVVAGDFHGQCTDNADIPQLYAVINQPLPKMYR